MSVEHTEVEPLQAVPDLEHDEARPQLDVIEGGLDRAARWVRVLGSTMLVTFIVGLVGALAVHATIVEHQQELDEQRRQIEVLATETEGLRHELAELEAPARIDAEARRLGMIEAPSVTYLRAPSEQLSERAIGVAERQLLKGR